LLDFILYVLTPQVLHGLVWGMTLVLASLGLTVVFGLLGVVNFAHGEFYMLGAFFAYTTLFLIPNFWVALVVAGVFVAILALAIEFFMFRRLYGNDPIFHLLLTFGLAMIFREVARAIWGGITKRVLSPVPGSVEFLGITYPTYRLVVLCITVGIFIAIIIFMSRTQMGSVIKAASLDSTMLSALGFNVPIIYSLTFVAGAILAAISGVVMSPIYFVYPLMGLDIILRVFIVVIVGGLGSIKGAFIAGILIGEIESISAIWIPPSMAETLVYVMLIVILILKPSGLCGKA
jgi:branched-chain amino acid transport system permease protein